MREGGFRRASAWLLCARLLRVAAVGQKQAQDDEQIGRSGLRAEINKAAQIGDNHVAHRAPPSVKVREIAKKQPAMPVGLPHPEENFIGREPGNAGASG